MGKQIWKPEEKIINHSNMKAIKLISLIGLILMSFLSVSQTGPNTKVSKGLLNPKGTASQSSFISKSNNTNRTNFSSKNNTSTRTGKARPRTSVYSSAYQDYSKSKGTHSGTKGGHSYKGSKGYKFHEPKKNSAKLFD